MFTPRVPYKPSKFRTNQNQRLVKGLFVEYGGSVYTLKDTDQGDTPSLYRLYMEANDLTEYTFALTHMDSWEHWQMLCSTSWFPEYVDRWRKELEVRTRSEALARLIEEAKAGGKGALAANKFLLERGYLDKATAAGRGRPSKKEIQEKALEIAFSDKQVSDDLARLSEITRN